MSRRCRRACPGQGGGKRDPVFGEALGLLQKRSYYVPALVVEVRVGLPLLTSLPAVRRLRGQQTVF